MFLIDPHGLGYRSASVSSVHVLGYGLASAWSYILRARVPVPQWLRQHRRDAQEKHKTDRGEHGESR